MIFILKNLRSSLFVLVFVLVFFCGFSGSFAQTEATGDQNLQQRISIETHLISIARLYDPMASGVLRIIPKPIPEDLTLEPFLIQPKRSSTTPLTSEAQFFLTVGSKKIPERVVKFLETTLKDYGFARASIQIQELPDTDSLSSQGNTKNDSGSVSDSFLASFQDHPKLFVILGVMMVALILVFLFIRNALKTIATTIERSAKNLQNITSPDGLSGPSLVQTAATPERESRSELRELNEHFQHFPTTSLISCFMDAYWAHEDGYAAFLWSQFLPQVKKEILAKYVFIREYVLFLKSKKPINTEDLSDPYYLNPLDLSAIDQNVLTGLIRKKYRFYHLIPLQRRHSLGLSLPERLEISLDQKRPQENDLSQFLAAIKEYGPSPLRSLELDPEIRIKNREEEAELLAFSDLPLEFIKTIPSLGWLLRLPLEQRTAILDQFQAKDLALAWTGPDAVLEELFKALPEAKKKTVQSYLEKTTPSRQSPAFARIHQLTFQKLTEFHIDDEAA